MIGVSLDSRVQPTLSIILEGTRRLWQPLILTGVVFRVLGILIFTPFLGLLIWFFLAASGNTIVADEDLLRVLLDPLGITALAIIGGVSLAAIALEQACLMTISIGGSGGARR